MDLLQLAIEDGLPGGHVGWYVPVDLVAQLACAQAQHFDVARSRDVQSHCVPQPLRPGSGGRTRKEWTTPDLCLSSALRECAGVLAYKQETLKEAQGPPPKPPASAQHDRLVTGSQMVMELLCQQMLDQVRSTSALPETH